MNVVIIEIKPEMECTYRKWAGLVQDHELLAAVNNIDGFWENRSLMPGIRIRFLEEGSGNIY